MTEELLSITHQDFRDLLNQKIMVRNSENYEIPAEITQVLVFENFEKVGKIPFSVELRIENSISPLNQGVYAIEHPVKGELLLFIVPVGVDSIGKKYEIVFS